METSTAFNIVEHINCLLSGRGSNTQPSNWEANNVPLLYCHPNCYSELVVTQQVDISGLPFGDLTLFALQRR